MSERCDVLINGGGVPGLALALLLGRFGLSVIVADPAPPMADGGKPDGRTAALMAGSVNILTATGVWDDCAAHGAPLETLRIIEDGPKPVQADFAAADIGLPWFGINMPNRVLRLTLAQAVASTGKVHFLTPNRVEHFTADDTGVTAVLAGGETIRCRLVVGADGRASAIRSLAGIKAQDHSYGQSAITCLLDHSKAHDNISTEFHRPGGPFTLVPMPGMMSSVVWVEYDQDADAMLALRRDDFVQALQDRTKNLLGTVTLASDPVAWPLISMRAKTMTAPRVALVAEAAHILHPLGAQGLNLSLRDAATLAEEIADAARRGLDIGSAETLRRYEFRRRADVLTRSVGTDGLNKMVSNDISLLRMLRGIGLKTIDGFSPLRRLAMNEGVVPGYDDSRLSRGEAL